MKMELNQKPNARYWKNLTGKPEEEINLQRLLKRCEEMVEGRRFSWRLEAYVEKLEEFLITIEKRNTLQPSHERLNELRKRIVFVKAALHVRDAEPEKKVIEAIQAVHHPERNVRLRQKSRVESDIRASLFDNCRIEEKDPRHKADKIHREHEAMQEKILDGIASHTHDLKRNALAAKNIIAKDTEVVAKNLLCVEDNQEKLRKESARLSQRRGSCNFDCTMLVILWVAVVVFVFMCIFIRVFTKNF